MKPKVTAITKVTAIITSAGSGSRFMKAGKGMKPKQYQLLNGYPVVLHSLLAFQKCKDISEIFVSAGREYFEFIHSLAAKHNIRKLTTIVEGGKTRFESVKNAFNQIKANAGDIVLIHDAARPNINTAFVSSLIIASVKTGNVIPAKRVSETIKRAKDGLVKETLNRDELWLVQTPQAFRYKDLGNAYRKAGRKKDFTDEASLIEYAGYKVRIVPGYKDNIKITTSDDMLLLKKIMK